MFDREKKYIKIWATVLFEIEDLSKANKLKLLYSATNNPIGLEDDKGNEWVPIIAFTDSYGNVLVNDSDFNNELGISAIEYYDSGVSEPYE